VKFVSTALCLAEPSGAWSVVAQRVRGPAYEKRSLALTSNLHPAGFDELMPKSLAAATVDRLLYHAHVLVTDGTESYRLAQATAGEGVMPLA
jgi:DNA replication protein DnaC